MWPDDFAEELLRKSDRKFKSWTLDRPLGSGNSGVVFQALDPDNRAVALKIYNPKFVANDRLAKKPNHYNLLLSQLNLKDHDCPYLVQIRAGGQWQNTSSETYYYLCMDLVEGVELSQYQRHPPPHRIAPLVAQIAKAAQYLESRNVVHRDIKPSNIMLTHGYRKAILLDTGVIASIEPMATYGSSTSYDSTGAGDTFQGTFAYAPPEYIRGKHTQDSDGWRAISFYQLGALIYELLYSEPIYHQENNRYVQIRNRFDLLSLKEEGPPDLRPLPRGSEALERLRSLAALCLSPRPHERLKRLSWSDFACERQKKQPMVVFLYAGGTIGSHDNDEAGHALNEIPVVESKYLDEMSQRVLKEYSLTFLGGEKPFFDLTWRIVPPEFQLLSENSDAHVLSALSESVAAVLAEFTAQGGTHYLLGVVVLHGTDTLAYTAAGLHFALPSLPCPVLLTGSNIPPDRNDPLEPSLFTPRSDAWKNLSRCLHFLGSFGHRLCEVFVLFAATVVHPLNVKKIPTSSVPLREEIATRLMSEPFVFRNDSSFRSMAFKLIDGSFCNNFYPIAGAKEYTFRRMTATDASGNSSPHARSWQSRPFDKPRYEFDPGVYQLTASPGVAPVDLSGCKVLLLEGFASGTFASLRHHRFRRTLEELARRSIPLVLVAADGIFPLQEHYKTEDLDDGKPFPIITLYRTLPSTAFPLLSLVVGELPDDRWTPSTIQGASWRELLEHRSALLKAGITNRIGNSVVASSVLGNITRRNEQITRVQQFRSDEDSIFKSTADELFRFGSVAEMTASARAAARRDSGNLVMRKGDFLGLLYLAAQPYSAMGSMPDTFATLSFSGFTWVRRVAESLAGGQLASARRLHEVDKVEIGRREGSAKRLVTHIGKILHLYGWGVESCGLGLAEDLSSYTLDLQMRGNRLLMRKGDELYGTYNWTFRDQQFFRELGAGIPLEEDDDYFAKRLRGLYDHDFARQFSPFEWILVGMLRALSIEVGRILAIDGWTMDCLNASAFELLRASGELKATSDSPDRLGLELKYSARRYPGSAP